MGYEIRFDLNPIITSNLKMDLLVKEGNFILDILYSIWHAGIICRTGSNYFVRGNICALAVGEQLTRPLLAAHIGESKLISAHFLDIKVMTNPRAPRIGVGIVFAKIACDTRGAESALAKSSVAFPDRPYA